MSAQQLKKSLASIAAAGMMFLFCGAAQAQDVQYPVAAYKADELAKVQEWEKTWAGKKIDKSNIDQVAQFLPEQIVQLYKDPKKWGAPRRTACFFPSPPITQVIETNRSDRGNKEVCPDRQGECRWRHRKLCRNCRRAVPQSKKRA